LNTLLIIDDDVGTQETLQALLASEARRLEFVSNPTKALGIATELQPDLILLDVLMPGRDGFELCRQIRANPALAEVPILLLTVLDDRDSRLAGIAAGADDFVSKPFDRAELTMRVQSILRLNRYRRLLEERTKVDQLTEYALVVSHDLKAPLRGMRQLADWIARDHAARLDSEGQQLFTLLQERVRELDRMIDGLLECARVGKSDQVERQVATGELVREIAGQLALPPLVKVVIDPDLPTVNASRERLQQVFQNLLDNALASLDQPQGRLRVSATRRVAAWEVLVADNGRGIAARFLDRVFEPYWRLRRSGDKPGVGLGLTLVKRIVEDRGGAAWIRSQEGRGTTVHFTWPDERADRQRPPSQAGRGAKRPHGSAQP